MVTANPQAISGVSVENENVVMTVYPSICKTSIGRLIGRLMELFPLRIPICGIRLSYLIFGPVLAPLGLLIYIATKLHIPPLFFGERYVVSNRQVQIWSSMGNRRINEAALSDIEEIEIRQEPGQVFYRASDLHFINSKGELILTLGSVPHAQNLREVINKTRFARSQVGESLKTIEARSA